MKYISLLLCLSLPTLAAAIPPGQWQCTAFDGQESEYEAFGNSMKEAMDAALEGCKKKSPQRQTCKTAQSFCEQGPLSLMGDRCIVSDENGRTWNATGVDACKIAMQMCNEWQFLHGIESQCSVKHREEPDND